MTTIAEKNVKPHLNEVLNVSGILYSVNSMSLLNLFSILPIGVDSKKLIPHL